MSTRIFVYGTLMQGQGNHRLLIRARYAGPARTEPAFDLIDMGAFPAMLAGGLTAVAGELYDVDAGTLEALDRLEGHPSFYERRRIRLANREQAEAYIYSQRRPGCPLITSGDWRKAKGV